jgi:hypothetical protein
MASVPYKFTTVAGNNLQVVRAGQTSNLKGLIAVCNAVYDVYIKFYWFTPTTANPTPVVGTTVPNLTVAAPANNTATPDLALSFPDGITGNGQLWVSVTKNANDLDNTATAANDAIVTILVE